jgi:hypothetical protein
MIPILTEIGYHKEMTLSEGDLVYSNADLSYWVSKDDSISIRFFKIEKTVRYEKHV